VQKVLDLWRQQDVSESSEEFTSDIAPHGVRFIKVSPGNSRSQATTGR